MAPIAVRRIMERVTDPFGFSDALRGLALAPEDLPSLTRECRHTGRGC